MECLTETMNRKTHQAPMARQVLGFFFCGVSSFVLLHGAVREQCQSLCPLRSTKVPLRILVFLDCAFQRSSDSSLSHEDLAKVLELQEVIDRQAREQSQMKERLASLSSHAAELEEDLDTARKDLIKSEEMNTKLQRDVHEVSVGCTWLPVPSVLCSYLQGPLGCRSCALPSCTALLRGLHASMAAGSYSVLSLNSVPSDLPTEPTNMVSVMFM